MKKFGFSDNLFYSLRDYLYSDPEAFLRELVSNSYDAIKRRFNDTSKGRIVIRGDGKGHIEIEDNGVGMREHDLTCCLSKVGYSSATDLKDRTIGRFGIGFLSAIAVADYIRIDTVYSGNGYKNPCVWVWKGGTNYSIHLGKKEKPGTIVRIKLNKKYASYSSPKNIVNLVLDQMPFLNVSIEIPPFNDPRSFILPLQQRILLAQKKLRNEPALFEIPHWGEKPLHCFATYFTKGEWGIFAFPKNSIPYNQGNISVYNQGVLISKKIEGVLPSGWEWINGIINISYTSPTLSRQDIIRDSSFKTLKNEIRNTLKEELIFLNQKKSSLFQELLEQNCSKIAKLLCEDKELLEKVGYSYQFNTTLGKMSFQELLQKAVLKDGAKVLYFIENPMSDHRWATFIHRKILLVWCKEFEEDLFINLVNITPGTLYERLIVDNRATIHDGLSEEMAPWMSNEMKDWIQRLRSCFKNRRINVEPMSINPEDIIAVIEVSGLRSKVAQLKFSESSSGPGNLFKVVNFIHRTIGSSLTSHEGTYGRLIINVKNRWVKQLAKLCPVKLAAALLMTVGIVQNHLPIEVEWQDILDKLTKEGIKGIVESSNKPYKPIDHIRCFFAHDFKYHKRILYALKKVLEHSPFFWEVLSADEEIKNSMILNNIQEQISSSHIFLAEVSNGNPNVFLELGMALATKDKEEIMLFQRKGSPTMSDLEGHIYFSYEDKDLEEMKIFIKNLQKNILKYDYLVHLRGKYPFLSYRLVEEEGIVTEYERCTLENKIRDAYTFLSKLPEDICYLTCIPLSKIKKIQDYFNKRIKLHDLNSQSFN